ncbi:hypothetical protein ACJ41O_005782 [Fusarium nematophilum]
MPRKKSPKKWSMYPALHGKVASLLEEDDLYFTFYDTDDDNTRTESYDTNIMGRFKCYNPKCSSSGWSSKKIAITIRMYEGERYNARVYHQHCKECNSLSRPYAVDESYADRIAYRIKKWNGIEQEVPEYSRHTDAPHEEDLCSIAITVKLCE